jgi:hypothetical protein
MKMVQITVWWRRRAAPVVGKRWGKMMAQSYICGETGLLSQERRLFLWVEGTGFKSKAGGWDTRFGERKSRWFRGGRVVVYINKSRG